MSNTLTDILPIPRKIFNLDEEGFICIKGNEIRSYINAKTILTVEDFIDELGLTSAKARGIKLPCTTFADFIRTDERIYIKFENEILIGFIHIGNKTLNYKNQNKHYYKITAPCIIDFWVNPKLRRKGNGKMIFEKLLNNEDIPAHKLIYFNVSNSMMKFIKKHFGFYAYNIQSSTYIVFDNYFENKIEVKKIIIPTYSSSKDKSIILNNLRAESQGNRIQSGISSSRIFTTLGNSIISTGDPKSKSLFKHNLEFAKRIKPKEFAQDSNIAKDQEKDWIKQNLAQLEKKRSLSKYKDYLKNVKYKNVDHYFESQYLNDSNSANPINNLSHSHNNINNDRLKSGKSYLYNDLSNKNINSRYIVNKSENAFGNNSDFIHSKLEKTEKAIMDHKNNLQIIEKNIKNTPGESEFYKKNKEFVSIKSLHKPNKTIQSLDILNYIIERKNEYLS